jgi:hypothetical protein
MAWPANIQDDLHARLAVDLRSHQDPRFVGEPLERSDGSHVPADVTPSVDHQEVPAAERLGGIFEHLHPGIGAIAQDIPATGRTNRAIVLGPRTEVTGEDRSREGTS